MLKKMSFGKAAIVAFLIVMILFILFGPANRFDNLGSKKKPQRIVEPDTTATER